MAVRWGRTKTPIYNRLCWVRSHTSCVAAGLRTISGEDDSKLRGDLPVSPTTDDTEMTPVFPKELQRLSSV